MVQTSNFTFAETNGNVLCLRSFALGSAHDNFDAEPFPYRWLATFNILLCLTLDDFTLSNARRFDSEVRVFSFV